MPIDIYGAGSGGGSGEANTTSNDGAGEGLAKAKVGVDLPFKSLVAGSGMSLSSDANEVTITATGGAGSDENVKISANDTTAGFLNGKLVAGTNTSLTENNDGGNESLQVDALTSFTDADNSLILAGSTGLLTGGEVTINADPTLIDIAAGTGVVVDTYTDPANATYTEVSWSAMNGISPSFIATDGVTYLLIDSAGSLSQSASFPINGTLRDNIQLGAAVHPDNVNVSAVSNFTQCPVSQLAQTVTDLTIAMGVINEAGNVYFGTTGTLQIEKTAGISIYAGIEYKSDKKDPNRKITPIKAAATPFIYSWRDGAGSYNTTATALITPQFYDDDSGGASNPAGAVGNNEWTITRIFYSPDADTTVVQYGQNIYGSQNAALDALARGTDSFVGNPDFGGVPLRAFMICKGNETDMTSANVTFTDAGKFGATLASGGVVGGVTTLQSAYEVSSTSNEIITNTTNNALCIQRGTLADTDDVLCVQNGALSTTFAVQGDGAVDATTVNTGQGDNELYAMNQAVQTTDSVTFNNITPTGTVDGRDVATDGTKLDGIEAGAEVNTVDSVNTQTGAVVLDADDVSDAATTNKYTTAADITKLAGIEALADVTDETNVVSALDGATLTAVTVASTDKVIVQDASDSDNIKTVTAQSIADLGGGGGGGDAEFIGTFTVSGGNLTITGLNFTTYNKYVIAIDGISVSGGSNPQINARPNSDSSAVYDFGNFQNLNGVLSSEASTATTFWRVIRNVANLSSASEASIVMTVIGDNQTANKFSAHWSSYSDDPDTYNAVGAGNWNDGADMTSLLFTNLGTGTISTATAKVYGFKE
jgi:hypothetical protein